MTIVAESSLGVGAFDPHDTPHLSALRDGEGSRVTRLALADEIASYLRAVGVEEGVRVRILRRAPLGGPLHVQTSSGAEFAIDLDLARRIEVAR